MDRSLPLPAMPVTWACLTFREILASDTINFYALSPNILKLLWTSTTHDSIGALSGKPYVLEEIAENFRELSMPFIWTLYPTQGPTEVLCHSHLCQALRHSIHSVYTDHCRRWEMLLSEGFLSNIHSACITVAAWYSSMLYSNLFKTFY